MRVVKLNPRAKIDKTGRGSKITDTTIVVQKRKQTALWTWRGTCVNYKCVIFVFVNLFQFSPLQRLRKYDKRINTILNSITVRLRSSTARRYRVNKWLFMFSKKMWIIYKKLSLFPSSCSLLNTIISRSPFVFDFVDTATVHKCKYVSVSVEV